MPRARNIKPGFFRNEDLVEVGFEVRLLFIGLWTLADREGRLEDRPKRIKMEIFPADNVEVDDGLSELADLGMLLRYEVDGRRYIQITNFSKHQNPHHKEVKSEIPGPESPAKPKDPGPEPDTPGADPGQAPDKSGADPADSLIPDSLIPDPCTSGTQGAPPDGELDLQGGEGDPPDQPKRKRSKPARPIPDDFTVTAEMVRWANDNGLGHVNLVEVTDEFVDYWRGEGKAKADWVATWRNRVRDRAKRIQPGGRGSGPLSAVDRVRAATGQ